MTFLANTLKGIEKKQSKRLTSVKIPLLYSTKQLEKNTNLVNFGYLSQKHINSSTFFSAGSILCKT